jgi:hypothetical protein
MPNLFYFQSDGFDDVVADEFETWITHPMRHIAA